MNNKRECVHNWRSVYYGSNWEVECKKCDKNIYDTYEVKEANEIINSL